MTALPLSGFHYLASTATVLKKKQHCKIQLVLVEGFDQLTQFQDTGTVGSQTYLCLGLNLDGSVTYISAYNKCWYKS